MKASRIVALSLLALLACESVSAQTEYCQRDVTRPFQRGCDSFAAPAPVYYPQPAPVYYYPQAVPVNPQPVPVYPQPVAVYSQPVAYGPGPDAVFGFFLGAALMAGAGRHGGFHRPFLMHRR